MDYATNGGGGSAERDPAQSTRADEDHARRAASFGSAASAYARLRPDYPAAAIGWALAPVLAGGHGPGGTGPAGGTGQPVRIADLGAGTGKLTAQLAALATPAGPPSVVAVEPDPRMLAELRVRLPGVTAVAGRAEAIPLPDASVDAVIAGQAAHWFDMERAMPQIARVLVPGGVIAGLWNTDDDRVGWVSGLHEACGRASVAAYTAFAGHGTDQISGWLAATAHDAFGPPERAVFEHGQAHTIDSLVQNLATHSVFLVMAPAERDAVLGRVRQYLEGRPETGAGAFTLPICTVAVRAVRR